METPVLKEVDLSKCFSTKGGPGAGSFHDHPDIVCRKQYLALIKGKYFAGYFSRQWYGWNFDGWHGCGMQLDRPGTNSSLWEGLWEIVCE
jgi:hypothetical protein